MELAALASAAIPGLSPTGVAGSPDDPRDFDAAVVLDREGNQWRVRSPRHQEAAMRLETELQVLSGFTPAVRAALPFRAPSVAGAVRLEGMRTFIYHDLPGRETGLEGLITLGGQVTQDVGRVIAAIHSLPSEVVENADLPVYTADQFRQRRLNELDQAATTGRIPPLLLRRWENALEEKELWQFAPSVVHGDLHEDNLLIDRGRVVGVTGWTDLRIGDPADDFAWLASTGDPDFVEAVLDSYRSHRGKAGTVPHLLRRAALAAEFALAQWLVRGLAAEDAEMITEAEQMLHELVADVETYGGQEISLPESGEAEVRGVVPEPARPGILDDAGGRIEQASGAEDAEIDEAGGEETQGDDAEAVITDADLERLSSGSGSHAAGLPSGAGSHAVWPSGGAGSHAAPASTSGGSHVAGPSTGAGSHIGSGWTGSGSHAAGPALGKGVAGADVAGHDRAVMRGAARQDDRSSSWLK